MRSRRIESWRPPTSPPPDRGRSSLPKSRRSKSRGARGARGALGAKGAKGAKGALGALGALGARGARRVLAIAAHPDDIEFMMAGTLLLLGEAGWELHYMNVSSGNLGSLKFSPAKTARIRSAEAQASATLMRAVWHEPICHDLQV